MCIIAYKPAGVWIGKRKLRTMFNNNSDGAGFMYRDKHGKVIVKKGFFSYELFMQSYLGHVNKDTEAVLHFRIMTCGTMNKANTHPHACGHGAYLAHNGHFNFGWSKTGSVSDSMLFGKALKQFGFGWWDNLETLDLVDMAVGNYNKVVILPPGDADVVIFNESAGNWHAGVWYSNTTWKPAFNHTGYKSDYYKGYDPWGMTSKKATHKPATIEHDEVVGVCRLCGNDILEGDYEFTACLSCGHDLTDCMVYTYNGEERGDDETTEMAADISNNHSVKLVDIAGNEMDEAAITAMAKREDV